MKTRKPNKPETKKEIPELLDPADILEMTGLSPDDTEELPERATPGIRIEDLEAEPGFNP